MEGFDEEIESILYMCREVSGASCVKEPTQRSAEIRSVFKIPPLKKNEGHRAQEWGDLGNPLWKGRLRIIEKGTDVSIKFEDPTTGASPHRPGVCTVVDRSLQVNVCWPFACCWFQTDRSQVFANAPYDPAKPSVEGVLDSSRYFVVRVEDGGRKAYIGMGFLERSDSFDFSTSMWLATGIVRV